jgi:hypothetical protein
MQRALALTFVLTGRSPDSADFTARLNACFAEDSPGGDEMTKEEFADLMGLEDVSDEFWRNFCGRESRVIMNLDDFVDALDTLQQGISATGDTLYALAESDNIVRVPMHLLGLEMMRYGLGAEDFNTSPNLEPFLQRAWGFTGQVGKPDIQKLSEAGWDYLASEFMDAFVTQLSYQGYDDINKLDLNNPWVLERFGEMFEKYVQTADVPSPHDLDELLDFQGRVERFEAWAKEQKINTQVYLSQFDINGHRDVLDNVLENYGTLGKEGVLAILRDPLYQKEEATPETQGTAATDGTSAPPAAVTPAAVESGAEVPLVDPAAVEPGGEGSPHAALVGTGAVSVVYA